MSSRLVLACVALVVAISGCTASPEDNNGRGDGNAADARGGADASNDSVVSPTVLRNFTLVIDFGLWPQASNVEAHVGLRGTNRPSEPLLSEYGEAHPGNTTALDVLVAWAESTDRSVDYEEAGPVVRAIDGVGNPVDPQIPPWWCYLLNGETPDVSAWRNEVAANDHVEFFYADCGGP